MVVVVVQASISKSKEQIDVITEYNVKTRLQFSILRRPRERVQRFRLCFGQKYKAPAAFRQLSWNTKFLQRGIHILV